MRRIKPFAITIVVAALLSLSAIAKAADNHSLTAISAALEAKQYDRALQLSQTLADNDPLPQGLEDVLYQGGATSVHQMKLEPAAGFYRLLLDKFPESKHASTARAELLGCYNFLRRLDDCIAQAKINLELDPESRWVEYWNFIIAQSHFRLWKFAEAKTKLDAFLVEYPDGDYADHARRCLSKIDPPWEVDEHGLVNDSSKYVGDVRLEAAVKSLPADMEVGFRMLEDRLGLDLRPHTHVIYLFQDAGNKAKPGVHASTYDVGIDNKPVVVMRFYTEFVVSQPEGYHQTIIHEMKHAGFKGIMGHSYNDLPEWIREGLAVYGSDDVETRMQLVLSNRIASGKSPMTVLDGIDDGDHDAADYMEDALAFEWLESKKPGNVKAFCQALVKGQPYRELWSQLSGMSYADAISEANAHCRDRVESSLGQAYSDFRPLRRASELSINSGAESSKNWLSDGGKVAFQKWLADNPGHPVEPFARFCLARSLARAGQGDEARILLQQILERDCLRCTLLDDAQFWLGVSYNWERDFDNAHVAFGVLLRDYSSSNAAKQVVGKFPAAGPVTE